MVVFVHMQEQLYGTEGYYVLANPVVNLSELRPGITVYPIKQEFVDKMGGDLIATCELTEIANEIGPKEFLDYYCEDKI